MSARLFTSESVTEGHPDKICDQISDSILDAMLAEDAQARVAVETMVTTGLVHVAGEVSTTGYVEIPRIVRETSMSILLVEQNATAALAIVDHAYLIDNGRVVMSGTAEALAQNPDVQEFYLGGTGRVDYRNVKHYRRRKRWLA